MHFDALSLACVVAELQRTLAAGRIQQLLRVDSQTFGFEIYTPGTRHQLLVALHPGQARLQTVSYKLRRGADPDTPLLLLLRKYGRGAQVAGIEQPDPCERLVRLALAHPEHGATTLVLELIGHRPNALLLNPAGRILECLHHQTERADRLLQPGRAYVPPAPPAGLSPFDDGSETYFARLAAQLEQPGALWKALVAGVAGLSPTAAREIAWRVHGDAGAAAVGTSLLAVAQALQELWAPLHTGEWCPGTVEEAGKVVGFAAYPLHFRGSFVRQPTLSAALEQFYGQQAERQQPDPYAALRSQVLAQLNRARGQLERRLAALAGDEPPPGAAAELRTQASWLLALATQLEPGQSALVVDLGDRLLTVAVDPQRPAVEQAEAMFARATRLDRASAIIPQRRAQLQAEQEWLAQLGLDAQRAASQPELAAVLAELRAAGLLRGTARQPSAPRSPAGGPLRLRTPSGLEILVGRNARQNEQVTFQLAHPADLWLHVRGAPGAHVVVRSGGRPVEETDLQRAAQLAAYHSSLRDERHVDVMVAQRRWVSRAPGGRTGQVVVEQEQVLRVPGTLPPDLSSEQDGGGARQ